MQDFGTADRLLDAAFGTDRFGRTAYAIRRGMAWLTNLSFAALDEADGGRLVGLVQSWPVSLLEGEGAQTPLIMVGPVAVLPARQRGGIGLALMDGLIAAISGAAADQPLMMIGDAPYYGRWGFSADGTGAWRTPGPVDPARLLARPAPDGGALPVAGMLGPRRPG